MKTSSALLLGAGLVALAAAGGLYSSTKYVTINPGETWQFTLRATGMKINPEVIDTVKKGSEAMGVHITGASVSADGTELTYIAKFDKADKMPLNEPMTMAGRSITMTAATKLS